MEENSNIIVGLDIGTTKIVALVGKMNQYGKLEVLGMGRTESVGVSRGVVANIEKTVQSIKTAVEEAELKSNFDISKVFVGVAGQHIKSLQHRGQISRDSIEDEISEVDIKALLKEVNKLQVQPGEQIIAVLPQEYIIDKEPGILDPIGMSGICVEANCHIITGLTSAINNINRSVNKAGLTLENLILEPIASAEAVLSGEEKEAGVALVDIGGGTTDLAIFHDGIIRHTAVIPFGGNVITNDIKEGCSIIKRQAELLKVQFGSAIASENQENEIVTIPGLRGREPIEISVKNLANIIQSRMEEIIEHVFYEIKCSGYENKLSAGIVLTGGGAQLKHLPQLVEYMTGLYSRIGYPDEHLAKDSWNELKSPMYATVVGLALNGAEMIEQMKPQKGEVKETDIKKPNKQSWFKGIIDKFIDEDL